MKKSVAPFGGAGIMLRMLKESDLSMTLAWRNAEESRIWFKDSRVLTSDGHLAWFNAYLAKSDDYVFMVLDDEVPVGQVGVYNIDFSLLRAEVGRFLIAPDKRMRGYMTHACRHLLCFAFFELGMRELYLEVLEDNVAALRVYEKLGFQAVETVDGVIKMLLLLDGKGCLSGIQDVTQ